MCLKCKYIVLQILITPAKQVVPWSFMIMLLSIAILQHSIRALCCNTWSLDWTESKTFMDPLYVFIACFSWDFNFHFFPFHFHLICMERNEKAHRNTSSCVLLKSLLWSIYWCQYKASGYLHLINVDKYSEISQYSTWALLFLEVCKTVKWSCSYCKSKKWNCFS